MKNVLKFTARQVSGNSTALSVCKGQKTWPSEGRIETNMITERVKYSCGFWIVIRATTLGRCVKERPKVAERF